MVGRRHLRQLLHGIVILVDHLTAYLIRILGTGLPEERCQVVVVRTLTTTLEIDEERTSLAVQHHIPCLEVTIEESLCIVGIRQVLGQQAEVGFQLQLMEVNFRSLQEAVFEIVEVEEHRVAIESGLGITVGKVKAVGTHQLNLGQLTDGTAQQLLLFQRITATSLTTTTNGVEQRHRTQIGLDISQLVVADSKNGRNRQLTFSKMLGQVDEGVILVTTGTYTTYYALALRRSHAIVLTITSTSCQLLYVLGFFPTPFLV